jgi:hypothetical protein
MRTATRPASRDVEALRLAYERATEAYNAIVQQNLAGITDGVAPASESFWREISAQLQLTEARRAYVQSARSQRTP